MGHLRRGQRLFKLKKPTRDEFLDSARKENIWGRKLTRLELWEEHLKDPIIALDEALECFGESVSRLTSGSRHFVEVVVFNRLRPRGLRHGAKDVGQTVVERCLALFGPVGSCASAHSLNALECFEEVWAAWRALSSF